ncbi:sister chromatid cohesion protein PDS5 homolog B-like isoform X2 [Ciona intestinalis]
MDESQVAEILFPPGVKNVSSEMSPSELIKILKKCCKFFSQLEQDEEEMKREYLPFCHYITMGEFINETTDEHCRILIGCIIADVFRLHAPENPFQSEEKIKEIFSFMTEQLRHLEDTKGTFFPKAFHILENVATIKSFNICIDMDDPNAALEIFSSLFKTLFSTVNSGHDKQVKSHMLDIMAFAITDSSTVPATLLDIVLENLVTAQRMNPSAYELACDLLRRTASAIEPSLTMFFQNMIFEEQAERSRLSAHWMMLIPKLYKITPSLMTNTLPQLELKLGGPDPKVRLDVATMLSEMFSNKDSDLVTQHPALWTSFLGRFRDIDPTLRCTCVKFYGKLVINHETHFQYVKDAFEEFKRFRNDTDESVRFAVVGCIRGIVLKDIQLASNELLTFLKDKTKDKKWPVREAAIRAIGLIYKQYVTCEDASRIHCRRLQWIRDVVLQDYYTPHKDDWCLVEHVMVTCLVPYAVPDRRRMTLLFELYASIGRFSIQTFEEMLKKSRTLHLALRNIVAAFDLTNEEDKNRIIWSKIVFSAAQLTGSPQATHQQLKKFFRHADQDVKIKQWLKYIVSDHYSCKKVAVALRDLLKKIEDDGMAKGARSTAQQLLQRCSILPILVDQESLKILFELVKESLDGISIVDELNGGSAQARAMDLLQHLSGCSPQLFSSSECFVDLMGFIRRTDDENVVHKALLILKNTGSIIEEKFPEIRSVLIPELKSKAKSGPAQHAKHAVLTINQFTSVKESPLMQVFEYCKGIACTEGIGYSEMQTALTSIGCIAEVIPAAFPGQLRYFIASVVVKQVIMKTGNKSDAASTKGRKKEQTWCEKVEISSESKAKVAGMKCMVRWLRGLSSNDTEGCCGKTLRLLQHMLHNDGDLMKCGNISKADMSHLRLQAARCVLKIAGIKEYRNILKPVVHQELAMLINDPVLEVRKIFLNKLYCAVFRLQISLSFLALFSFVSQETVKVQREHGASLYNKIITRFRDLKKQAIMRNLMNPVMPEDMLPYLIYLMANDPDFVEGISRKSLARIKDCIHFILDPLLAKGHPESFGFVMRFAANVKRSRNAEEPDDVQRNENIYAVCDLIIQHVLKRSGQLAVAILDPPESSIIRYIPSALYTTPTGPENDKVYLPREFYTSAKSVPTLATTAAMGGDKYRRNLAHHGTSDIFGFGIVDQEKQAKKKYKSLEIRGGNLVRKIPSPKKPAMHDQSSSASTSTASPTKQSSSDLPTPPTSQSCSTQSSSSQGEGAKESLTPVRKSSRIRKPARHHSPSPPPAKRGRSSIQSKPARKKTSPTEDSMGDEASESESDSGENEATSLAWDESAASTSESHNSPVKRTSLARAKGSLLIASTSVKVPVRKTLGVNNNNITDSQSSDDSMGVRRSNRRRGK